MEKKAKPKARKGRDNFSQSVLKILCRRAGGKCCKCGAVTLGPVKSHPTQSVNIGKGAHIAAAAPGGPRYDPKMSVEERTGPSNGMWLCSNCHDTIDRDTETYPTAVLKKMKKDAEDRIRKELGVATFQPIAHSGSSELVTGISAVAILEIRRTKTKFLDSLSREGEEGQAELALGELAFLDFEQDEYSIEVAEEVLLMLRELAFRSKVPTSTLEVLRRVKSIADVFNSQWDKPEQVRLVCQIVEKTMEYSNKKRSKVYQSGLALLKDISSYKALKANELNRESLSAIKKLRGQEEVDAPDGKAPDPKRQRLDEEGDVYITLMETLATTTDTQQILSIESQIEEMGYEPHIQ